MSKTGDEYHWDFGDGEISTEEILNTVLSNQDNVQ